MFNARADKGDEPVRQIVAMQGNGTVKGDRVNVRSRPSTTAEVVAQVNRGDNVEVLGSKAVTEKGKERAWLNIVLPANAKVYVAAKHVKDGSVVSDAVYARCGPGSNYRDVGKLNAGDRVEVVQVEGDWARIQPTSATTGWVAAELIDLAPVERPPAPVSEVVTPPVSVPAPVPRPLPTDKVEVISTDPEVHVGYVIKNGVVKPSSSSDDTAPYELMTREDMGRQHRITYLEAPADVSMDRYVDKYVRVSGNQRWHKGERYPVLAADRIDIVW